MKGLGRQRHGFSLIELMAAVSLLGLGITALLFALSDGLKAFDRVERRATAVSLLENLLQEVRVTPEMRRDGRGVFPSPHENYSWQIVVTGSFDPGLEIVAAEVTWEGRAGIRRLESRTLAAEP